MSDPRSSLATNVSLSKSRVRPYEGFIFLCGGETNIREIRPVSVRDALYRELAKTSVLERRVRLAEHYKDWAHDSVYRDLVTFEEHLAELSSVIVLVLESAGSIAELGLFSVAQKFREKLLVFVSTHHYDQQSFIRLGLINFLEKTHQNLAHCHPWLKSVNGQWIFDPEAAESFQPELAEAVTERLGRTKSEVDFSFDVWLHKALLVCDIINLMSAMTVGEIQDQLTSLGLKETQSEVRQTLYLLQRVGLLTVEPSGDQRFYINIDGRQFINFRQDEASFDVDRFRSDVLSYYSQSDKKRFKAIQRVRSRN